MTAAAVKYRALDGHVLDAKLLVIEGDRATVDIVVPGTAVPFRRTRIPYPLVDTGERGIAFPVPKRVTAEPGSQLGRRAARAVRVAAKAAGRS